MRTRITLYFILAYLFVYWAFTVLGPNKYIMPAISALSVVLFGIFTYIFQVEMIRFNRFSHRPSLLVDKDEIQNRVIKIENTNDDLAYDIYIASFLVSHDGKAHVILYDEFQGFIAKADPVVQGDILKQPFRNDSESVDTTRYGTPLKDRLKSFIKQHSGQRLFLVVALRSPFQENTDTPLFIFGTLPVSKIEDANWNSVHFEYDSPLYRTALKVAHKSFKKRSRDHI
jgi:hypothetical protein